MATIKNTEKRLSAQAINALRYNTVAKNRLATLVNKSAFTVGVWLRKNDPRLVFENSIRVISEETGLNDQEILDPETLNA